MSIVCIFVLQIFRRSSFSNCDELRLIIEKCAFSVDSCFSQLSSDGYYNVIKNIMPCNITVELKRVKQNY